MKSRPTLDDLQKERADFIGPREPPRGPKMQRQITEQELDDEGRYWEERAAEISRDLRSRGCGLVRDMSISSSEWRSRQDLDI